MTPIFLSIGSMFGHPFIVHAFIATTFLAPACGLVGYFVVLRNEVFAGDALSHVAFTGSLAALAFGASQRLGLFTATILFAVVLGALGNRARVGDVTIGTTFAWILGLGVFFLSLFTTHHATTNSQAGPSVLFGSVFGISSSAARQAAFLSIAICLAVLVIARPLLFASIDEAVASARGVRTRMLGVVFMMIVGVTVAEVTQVVGALLLLGLVATPAATAHRLTARPYVALWLSAVLCLAVVWLGLTISYLVPTIPPSFVLVGLAFAGYIAVSVLSVVPRQIHLRRRGIQVDDGING